MKYLLSLCLIFISISCLAQGIPFPGCGVMSGTNAASCTTSSDSIQLDLLGTGTTDTNAAKYACNKWIVAADITITEYIARYKYNSGSGYVKVCLLPHSAGTDLPDGTTCITGTDKQLDDAELTAGSFIDYTHTLGTPKDVDAGTYWVCNIEVDGMDRYFEDHSDTGERGCYGASACDTADANYVDASVQVYGCTR